MTTPADLTRVMNNARIRLAGVGDDVLKLELFNVLNEFLTGSSCWKDSVNFTTATDRTTYEIDSNEPATIISLLGVENADEIPVAASMPTPGMIELTTAPDGEYTYTAELALTVVDPVDADDYPRMPDWLLAKYYAQILDGLLGACMTQPAKPWTNERLAVYHTRRFRNGIAYARKEARHENLYDGQNWRFPHFATGSQR